MEKRKLGKIILPVLIAVIVIFIVLSSLVIVPSGNTGVVITMGKVSERGLSEGLHFKAPVVQNVVNISNKIQKTEVEANSTSNDLQSISSSVAVNFHITADSSPAIYRNIGETYSDTILQPAIQEAVKSVTAQYSAEELITKRSAVGNEIADLLSQKVGDYGIIIDKFNIVNFDFSAEFNEAIEQKQVAEQNKLRAQTEKQQKIIEAEAAASEKTIAAKAEADATKIKSEAEAKANKIINASLNGNLLKYRQIEKWDGKYPNVVSSDSSVLIDVSEDETQAVQAPQQTEETESQN
jgi:regulator of protease activity HflC (stomatin/prohibitin superfamily)